MRQPILGIGFLTAILLSPTVHNLENHSENHPLLSVVRSDPSTPMLLQTEFEGRGGRDGLKRLRIWDQIFSETIVATSA